MSSFNETKVGIYMKTEQAFNLFLKDFIKQIKDKSIEQNKAVWELETTGSKQAMADYSTLTKELEMLFCNEENAQMLSALKKECSVTSIELLRVLNLLIKKHKVSCLPESLIEEIAQKEALLSQTYANFRVPFEGKEYTENDLLEILKSETDVERRKNAWDASKQIGMTLSEQILDLVKKRNEVARRLKYSDYYQMQLDLQETDKKWLFEFLDEFDQATRESYFKMHHEIEEKLAEHYQVPQATIGPWAWADPFCQEDPLPNMGLDSLVSELDLVQAGEKFFTSMGFEVDDILKRSDLFERQGKNQHAFCMNLDRDQDIRILTNIRPNIRWLETVIHELGHAVYEKGYDPELNWYLKEPPHMITTEAIALITGRQAYDPILLKTLSNKENPEEGPLQNAVQSQKRRQLIFSRWVLVMVHFEASLYAKPDQDLNNLWWSLVQRYQGTSPTSFRGGKCDWACKYHIGLAPVYYHSYLLGEFFASMLKEHFETLNQSPSMYGHKNIAKFLQEKIFFHGNRMRWDRLIEMAMKKPLEFHAWVKQFC